MSGAAEVNADQRQRWNNEDGQRWVEEAELHDRMLADYGEAVLQAASPEPGERGLDVGCGNGALTLDLAARVGPKGSVKGVDLSGPMLQLARRRSGERALANVEFVQADAQVDDLGGGSFDFVTSRFGLMFFDDPVAAFSNLARSAKPGCRLAFSCWRSALENEWVMVPAAAFLTVVPMPELPPADQPGPFSLADPETTRAVLENAGWSDVELTAAEGRQWMGADVDAVIGFIRRMQMAKLFLDGVDDATQEKAWAAAAEALRPHQADDGVVLSGKAWLVTAHR